MEFSSTAAAPLCAGPDAHTQKPVFTLPRGACDTHYQAFLRLLKNGRTWCKFTGAYRISAHDIPNPDVTPLAHAIIEANPERVVWGTDWPHPKHDRKMPNDGEMCNRLLDGIPDAAIRDKVLVANPAKLYGF
jgi:predicted TIM-barrel fold metal-dependent hydrolase